MIKFVYIAFSLLFSFTTNAQTDSTIYHSLELQEMNMFEAISNNDSAYLQKLLAHDYVSINADGKMVDKEVTIKNLKKFKGANVKLSDKKIRINGNAAIINGRAKFYFRALLVADVWYTQIWQNQNGVWQYAGWQGTMTGWPSYYPVIVTIISIFLLWLIFMFVFKNRRKKTF